MDWVLGLNSLPSQYTEGYASKFTGTVNNEKCQPKAAHFIILSCSLSAEFIFPPVFDEEFVSLQKLIEILQNVPKLPKMSQMVILASFFFQQTINL